MDNLIRKSKNLAVVLLVIMFLLSGISKLFRFDEVIDTLKQKLTLSMDLYKLTAIMVILLEIVAPIIIIYYFMTGKMKKYAYYSTFGLIVFTILATIMYHPPDFSNYKRSIPFWANVSLIGGLMLLATRTL